MKKLAGNDYKEVNYFGVKLAVDTTVKYLATVEMGNVFAFVKKPDLDLDLGWLCDWEDFSICVATVDLEGMDWKDTLVEV
jgi:hypothetical protein